jgi:hypothetical protein
VTALPAVASTPASETTPASAGNGSGVLFTWTANGQIMGAVFHGSFGAPFTVTSDTNAHKNSAVDANPGSDYLVAFTHTSSTTADDVRGLLVSSAGAPNGTEFDISAGAGPQDTAAVSFDGTHFDVVWSTNNHGLFIYGSRVSTTAAVLDTHLEGSTAIGGTPVDTASNLQQIPTIACSSAGCLVSWQDRQRQRRPRVANSTSGVVSAPFVVSSATSDQMTPAIAYNDVAGQYVVVWADSRSGAASRDIYGARVTPSGTVLDPNGVLVATGSARSRARAS